MTDRPRITAHERIKHKKDMLEAIEQMRQGVECGHVLGLIVQGFVPHINTVIRCAIGEMPLRAVEVMEEVEEDCHKIGTTSDLNEVWKKPH